MHRVWRLVGEAKSGRVGRGHIARGLVYARLASSEILGVSLRGEA